MPWNVREPNPRGCVLALYPIGELPVLLQDRTWRTSPEGPRWGTGGGSSGISLRCEPSTLLTSDGRPAARLAVSQGILMGVKTGPRHGSPPREVLSVTRHLLDDEKSLSHRRMWRRSWPWFSEKGVTFGALMGYFRGTMPPLAVEKGLELGKSGAPGPIL